MFDEIEDWKAITPEPLVASVEHIRSMFKEGVWKCSQLTQKMCFAELHPDDSLVDLDPNKFAFTTYRKILGSAAAQRFDMARRIGTPPAIFHAFLQAMSDGISSEIYGLFNELLQIGAAQSATLKKHSAEWAKILLLKEESSSSARVTEQAATPQMRYERCLMNLASM